MTPLINPLIIQGKGEGGGRKRGEKEKEERKKEGKIIPKPLTISFSLPSPFLPLSFLPHTPFSPSSRRTYLDLVELFLNSGQVGRGGDERELKEALEGLTEPEVVDVVLGERGGRLLGELGR